MGFFKKIGSAIKKGAKQISLKNAIKVGSMALGSVPGIGAVAGGLVGSLQDAHYAKKEAKRLQSEGRLQEAQILEQQANQIANNAGANVGDYVANKSILSSTVQGAIGGAGATAVDLTAETWFKRHWKKLVIGLGAVATIYAIMKMRKGAKPRR